MEEIDKTFILHLHLDFKQIENLLLQVPFVPKIAPPLNPVQIWSRDMFGVYLYVPFGCFTVVIHSPWYKSSLSVRKWINRFRQLYARVRLELVQTEFDFKSLNDGDQE